MKPSMIEFVPAARVPFYFEVSQNFKWVKDLKQLVEVEREEASLKEEWKRTENLPVDKEELKEVLKGSHKKIEASQADNLVGFLNGYRKTGDPFLYLRQHSNANNPHSLLYIPPWGEVEAAIERLNFEGSISRKEREKKLEKIEKALAHVKADMRRLSPEKYFIGEDIRKKFVKHWRNVQRQCTGPVSPTGLALELTQIKGEAKAWEELGLDRLTSHLAPCLPNNGIGVIPSDLVPVPVDTGAQQAVGINLRQKQYGVISPGMTY